MPRGRIYSIWARKTSVAFLFHASKLTSWCVLCNHCVHIIFPLTTPITVVDLKIHQTTVKKFTVFTCSVPLRKHRNSVPSKPSNAFWIVFQILQECLRAMASTAAHEKSWKCWNAHCVLLEFLIKRICFRRMQLLPAVSIKCKRFSWSVAILVQTAYRIAQGWANFLHGGPHF